MTEEIAHTHPKKKKPYLNWNMFAVLLPLFVTVLAWGASIEVRLAKTDASNDLSQRMKNIEDLMVPMLVDWKVGQELKKHGINPAAGPVLPSIIAPPAPAPAPVEPEKDRKVPPPNPQEIEKHAQVWAESQVRQAPRNLR